jgi:hypothetical protein
VLRIASSTWTSSGGSPSVFNRWPRRPCSSDLCFMLCRSSGEPSLCQISPYFFADRAGRVVSTNAYRIGSHASRGISTTRGSTRNSARYRRTAAGVGASGVPRLTSSTPTFVPGQLERRSGLNVA